MHSDGVQGAVALVTGANRGIGKAIVESLIKQGADKVYAAVRALENANALIEKHGDKIVPVRIDLTQPETIIAAAKQCGDVNFLVNNAGVLSITNPFSDRAIEALQNEIEVNVFGLIRIAQAFSPILKINGGGVFVQLNSVASLKGFPDFATYSASKAAAYSITQSLRELLAEQGTRVLSIHPGPIDTDMGNEAGLSEIAEPVEVVSDAIIDALQSEDFHVFPDTLARTVGVVYQTFVRDILEANLMEENAH